MKKRDLKLTIAGAGSTYTTDMIVSLMLERENFPLSEIVLYDIDDERQKKVCKAGKTILNSLYKGVKISHTTDPKIAFKDSDFVFVQIRTGGLQMREKDEKIPLKHGCVGQETCGPGGMAYGLRTIGDMIDLVNKVREVNKEAWILNYSNPAAIVSIALDRAFPEDKRILNLCDMPVAIIQCLGRIINKDVFQMKPYYFGLNHFGWFTKLEDDEGNDVTKIMKDRVTGVGIDQSLDAEMTDPSWLATFKQLGVTLEDFPEFIPNTYLQYYLYPNKIVEKSDKNWTRANEVMNGREKRVFEQAETLGNKETITMEELKEIGLKGHIHGRYMVRVAASLAFNGRMQALAIVRNEGCIKGLADTAMVEVPCILTSNGPVKISIGEIPMFHLALLQNQNACEQLLVDGWFENDKTKILQSLVLNRTVVDTDKARDILEDLIEANKEYWPNLN